MADNDQLFLDTSVEFLRNAGYEVLTAITFEEARQVLGDTWVHLAIVDLRLIDDEDERDTSGITIARDVAPAIPKIILTSYPGWTSVRDALTPASAAVDYIAKQEGIDVLLRRVKEVLEKHVTINWDLSVEWVEGDALSMAAHIEPWTTRELMLNRAGELEDLLRSLFLNVSHIRIAELLWRDDGRVAVKVVVFGAAQPIKAFVVTCGRADETLVTVRRFFEYVPRSLGSPIEHLESRQTVHFAGIKQAFPGSKAESVETLRRVFQGSEKRCAISLAGLFGVLAKWQHGQRIVDKERDLRAAYIDELAWTGHALDLDQIEMCVSRVINQMPALGLSAQRGSERTEFRLGKETYAYRDAVHAMERDLPNAGPAVLTYSPGLAVMDGVLVDPGGRAWLTEFSGTGPCPVYWNYITVEAAIRFDWHEPQPVEWLHEFERELVNTDLGRLSSQSVEMPLRKSVRLIQAVRRFAVHEVGGDTVQYHFGMLFQMAKRLQQFQGSVSLTPTELTRFAHLVIAASLTAEYLFEDVSFIGGPAKMVLDEPNQELEIGGRRIPLRGQSFLLLRSLYRNANQLCTRRHLIESVFSQPYDERDASQANRLNTAIRRLRERVEQDPDYPDFIITESNAGYRLVTSSASQSK
jgi:DNA-binding response OmpR family regulator